jgi:hypothetical protein
MKAGHFVYSRPGEEAVELIAVEDQTSVRLLTPIEAVNLGADLFRHAAEIIRRDPRFSVSVDKGGVDREVFLECSNDKVVLEGLHTDP